MKKRPSNDEATPSPVLKIAECTICNGNATDIKRFKKQLGAHQEKVVALRAECANILIPRYRQYLATHLNNTPLRKFALEPIRQALDDMMNFITAEDRWDQQSRTQNDKPVKELFNITHKLSDSISSYQYRSRGAIKPNRDEWFNSDPIWAWQCRMTEELLFEKMHYETMCNVTGNTQVRS